MKREEQIYKAAEKATYQKPPQYSELVHKSRKVMCAYEIGFIDGYVWADTHTNWISVDEELPKSHEEVLVCATNGHGTERRIAWYYADKRTWCDNGIVSGVTHWMKLPGLPTITEE